MAKRKQSEEATRATQSDSESSSGDEADLVNVDFEWFDPQPEHDYHGIKTLLRQLLDIDSTLIDLKSLTELILAQPLLGSTVKVDGNETDPYAFLSVLNLHEFRDNQVIKTIDKYLRRRCASTPDLKVIGDLLQSESGSRIGLVLNERLMNVPTEVSPPMFKMLMEEIEWALEEKEPYDFTHYLILSKTYREVESLLEDESDDLHKIKKHKKGSSSGAEAGTCLFHQEDELFAKNSICAGSYTFENGGAQSDSKRVFQDLGIEPQGHLILLTAKEFGNAVLELQGIAT